MRRIFHTLDLYFGDDQTDNVHKGLDVFDRVKADQTFARRVKSLRIHWAYEEGDMLDLMMSMFFCNISDYFEIFFLIECDRDIPCCLTVLHSTQRV